MNGDRKLNVVYHGQLVGTLAEMIDERIAFEYSAQWLRNGFSISPISLPLENTVFVPGDRSRDRFGGLFGVFADSLPDAWGNLLLDRYLEAKGIRREDVKTLDRLAYIGDSGMGALEYVPSRHADFEIPFSGLNYEQIAKECNEILSSKPIDQLDLLFELGGSSGGTRPKIMVKDDEKDWIIKFPAKEDPAISGKREYDYSLCAKKCGINMTETELIPSEECEGYFKTERFDRTGGEKLFTITFAGLLEADFRAPCCGYETFMKLIKALTKDNKEDIEQMFRIMCFNILAHNNDDHVKNFSFMYTEDNGWRLAPAYDLTYSDTYWGEHTTSVCGKGKDISESDLVTVGTGAGLDRSWCVSCIDDIEEKTEELSPYFKGSDRKEAHIPMQKRISEIVKQGHKSCK